eukprot:Gb_39922 [translate_table: standard]
MASLAASFSSLTITQNSPKSLNKSFLGASLNPQNLKTRSNSNGLCLKAASVITMSAVTASGGLEKQDLSKYVKSRLLGGFAAQKLIGTGRRKAAVARVVLLEGTGQIIINSRTAQDKLPGKKECWYEAGRTSLSPNFLLHAFLDVISASRKMHTGKIHGQSESMDLACGMGGCVAELWKIYAEIDQNDYTAVVS